MHNLAALYALHLLREFEAPDLPVQLVTPGIPVGMVAPEMAEIQGLWMMLAKLAGTVQEQSYGKRPAV